MAAEDPLAAGADQRYWTDLTDGQKIETLRRHVVELFHLIRARTPTDLIATPAPTPIPKAKGAHSGR